MWRDLILLDKLHSVNHKPSIWGWWRSPVPWCAGETWATASVNDSLRLWCSCLSKDTDKLVLVMDKFPRNRRKLCERSWLFFPSWCKCGKWTHSRAFTNWRARDSTTCVQLILWGNFLAPHLGIEFIGISRKPPFLSHEWWCSCWRNHITWILWRQFNDTKDLVSTD